MTRGHHRGRWHHPPPIPICRMFHAPPHPGRLEAAASTPIRPPARLPASPATGHVCEPVGSGTTMAPSSCSPASRGFRVQAWDTCCACTRPTSAPPRWAWTTTMRAPKRLDHLSRRLVASVSDLARSSPAARNLRRCNRLCRRLPRFLAPACTQRPASCCDTARPAFTARPDTARSPRPSRTPACSPRSTPPRPLRPRAGGSFQAGRPARLDCAPAALPSDDRQRVGPGPSPPAWFSRSGSRYLFRTRAPVWCTGRLVALLPRDLAPGAFLPQRRH